LDPKAKILIISAMSQQALVVEAIRLGAKDFLNKPVNPDRLKDTVRKILANP
ncbi:MAG TPA: two-component system response regulator, partial [Candidatus Omnitrophica bacterium]|nr:two-component system response regulator [Candidatus Omnitrophota bacterium]